MENKNGFYLNHEMLPDWEDLDQTQVLFFHSLINDFVHDFGAGVTSEGIKTGSTTYCDAETKAGLGQKCYTYIRLFIILKC